MPTRDTSWPTGTPCWVECAYDPEHRGFHHAKDFYGRLFGWEVQEGPQESGPYSICLKDDRPAAAILPARDRLERAEWLTFFATDDVQASMQRILGAGGQVTAGPFEVGESGREIRAVDPTGASFAVWQATGDPGFGIVGEPGTVVWSTLLTRDLEAAKSFYANVFGWTYTPAGDYGVTATIDGTPVAGIHLAEQLPDDAPASWLVHFGVADRDASAQLAQELDGEILLTFDGPTGPEATIQAQHGEIFNLTEVP